MTSGRKSSWHTGTDAFGVFGKQGGKLLRNLFWIVVAWLKQLCRIGLTAPAFCIKELDLWKFSKQKKKSHKCCTRINANTALAGRKDLMERQDNRADAAAEEMASFLIRPVKKISEMLTTTIN